MSLATSFAVFLLLLLPPGLAILRWAGLRLAGGQHLGLALAIGYTALLPVRWLEELAGLPLVLPLVGICCIVLARQRAAVPDWRALGMRLLLPAALACLAWWMSASDLRVLPDGSLAFRVGFDVSDRAIYALFAQEIERSPPPFSENPLFAGIRSGYSSFPSLLGLLIHDYAPASLLTIFLAHLPALALLSLGLCLDGLLEAMGVVSRRARAVTVLLTVLGGDLSWLVDARNLTALDRTSHFLVFHSFAAESLFYNPWMLGLPLSLAGLHLALRWLRGGSGRELFLAGALLGGLWQTKVFACLPLLAGAWIAALLLRERRLLGLALAATAGAAPWAALTLLAGPGVTPLAPYPFLVVRMAVQAIRGLEPVAGLVGRDDIPALLALTALLPAFLLGSLGVRAIGLPRLAARVREDRHGYHVFVAASIGAALGLGLLTVGRPVATDGAQFLTLALFLMWLYTGPTLAEVLGRRGLSRGLGLILLVAATASPIRYLVLKAFPETWTPSGSWDRSRLTLPPQVGVACGWLRTAAAPSASLLLPLGGEPGDVGGLKPLYVAALCERRLAAYSVDFGVEPAQGGARRRATATVYTTQDPAAAERALQTLGARWVWEEPGRPLRFTSPRLLRRYDSSRVRLHEFVGP